MQQEMVRLHRGEENRLEHMAQKMFRPLWVKIEEMLKEGITSGELIPVDPSQIRYATLGANLFYFSLRRSRSLCMARIQWHTAS